MSYLLTDCSVVLFWFADCAVVIVKLDTKEQVLEAISSLFGTHNLFKVRYALLVENKSLEVPLFEDRLPLPADSGIAGEGVVFRFEPVILCYHFEDHRANLSRQSPPAPHHEKTFRRISGRPWGEVELEDQNQKSKDQRVGFLMRKNSKLWVEIVSFRKEITCCA